VDWIEAAGNYVKIHVGGQSHLVRDTLARLEAVLDPSLFARIHRSVIVNLDRVRQMEPWFSGEYLVLLHDGTQLKLSRWYRERVLERFAPGAGEISAGGPAE
jgi:two-component system LytT family response regulator